MREKSSSASAVGSQVKNDSQVSNDRQTTGQASADASVKADKADAAARAEQTDAKSAEADTSAAASSDKATTEVAQVDRQGTDHQAADAQVTDALATDPALQADLLAAAAQVSPQDVGVTDDTALSTDDVSDSTDTQDAGSADATDADAASLLAAMFAGPSAAAVPAAGTTATLATSETDGVTGVGSVSGDASATGHLPTVSGDAVSDAAMADDATGLAGVSSDEMQDSDIPDMGRFAGLMRTDGRAGGAVSDATAGAGDTSATASTTSVAQADTSATPSSVLPTAVAALTGAQSGAQPLANGTASLVSAKLTVSAQTASGSDDVSSLDTLGLSIASRVSDGVKHFAIRLDPPELGRVEVKLSVDSSGQASATLVAEKPHTLSLLQQDAGNLARTLQEAGVDLSNGGLNFSLSSGQQQGESSDRNAGGQSLQAVATVDSEGDASSQSYLGLDSDDVRLDIKV